MTQVDCESVMDRMRLSSGEIWPVPICLDIGEPFAKSFEVGQCKIGPGNDFLFK